MPASNGGSSLLSLLWVLICVLIIIGLAYFFTKYVVGRGKLGMIASGKRDIIKVLAKLPVNREGQLLLVQVGKRYFLIGNAASKITKLAEFTPEEAETWQDTQVPPDGQQLPSFGEALKKAWKERVKR